jgi:hypothetical protein
MKLALTRAVNTEMQKVVTSYAIHIRITQFIFVIRDVAKLRYPNTSMSKWKIRIERSTNLVAVRGHLRRV